MDRGEETAESNAGRVDFPSWERDGLDLDHYEDVFHPDLKTWKPVLDRLAIPPDVRIRIALQAEINGTAFQTEFIARGIVPENRFYRAMAEELGIGFAETVDPARLIARDADCIALLKHKASSQRVVLRDEMGNVVLVPAGRLNFARLRQRLRESPYLAARLVLTAPGEMRRALLHHARPALMKGATDRLFSAFPVFSARIGIAGWQGFFIGILLMSLVVAFATNPSGAWRVLHWCASIAFFSCTLLRLAAFFHAPPLEAETPRAVPHAEMPIYSVLVALRHEREVIPELLVALGKINWPRSKLEIKLICEADDPETIAAIRAHNLRPYIEVIEVPPFEPRTKPKALAFVMPLISGEFVVLYDAEDKPHRMQLRQAWQRFREGSPDLGCIQAPLEVTNREHSLIARSFWLEYVTLFRGLLPWLAWMNLPLPLGGTSNHFRGLM